MISHQSYKSIWISFTNHSVWGICLAPIISQLSCKWCHGIRRLCTKNDINHKFWASFDKCYGLWPSQEPLWLRSRFIRIWKVSIICIIFKFKIFFFSSFTYNSRTKQPTFHHVPWKQHPKSNQNIPNHCTAWTSGNFSCAWIVFHQSNSILPN